MPAQGEAGTDGGAGRGFADATLAGSDYEDLSQGDSPQMKKNESGEPRGWLVESSPVKPLKIQKYPLKARDVQHVASQMNMHGLTPVRIASEVFGNLVAASDGD
ncbi:hypothetical protein GCM10027514_39670 [Azotobacter armeniacus]